MSQAGNLFVVDEEFRGRGGELASHRNFFCEVLKEYVAVMDYLTSNIEGDAVEALLEVVDSIRGIPDEIVESGLNYQTDCEGFITSIDEADSFLY